MLGQLFEPWAGDPVVAIVMVVTGGAGQLRAFGLRVVSSSAQLPGCPVCQARVRGLGDDLE